MAHVRSYRESDNEEANIKAHYAALEEKRKARLSVEELVMEGLVAEEYRLLRELEKLREVASRISRTENQIIYHREKMARYKEAHGL
jgi:hypothetical protein